MGQCDQSRSFSDTLTWALLLTLFAVLAMPVRASPPETTNSLASTRENIQILGTHREDLGIEETVPAILVDDNEIFTSVPQVLTDALRGVRTVAVQTTTVGQGSPFIRGLTGSAILNLVDGMRLNNAIYRAAPTPYVALVEPRLIDQIEIVRGPASVRHGSDAMGGVIQLHTRRPTFEGDAWQTRGSLTGFFNSADLGRGMRAEIEFGNQEYGLRGGFSGLETDNLEGGEGVGRQIPSAYSALGGDLAFLWAPAEGQQISFDIQYAEQPKTPRYDEMHAGFGQTQPSASEFYYEPLERFFTHLSYEDERPSEFFDSLRLDLSFQRIRDDRSTREYESTEKVREQNTSELLGITARASKNLADNIRMNWGVDAYLDWVASNRQRTDILTGDTISVPARFPDGSTMNTYGVHSDFSIDLLPSLTLDGGIRYSYIDTEIPSAGSAPSGGGQQHDVTGSVGLLLEIWPNAELIASFRRGFRAPNIFDLGALGPRPGNRYNEPTSDLSPEVIYTTDLGFRHVGETAQTEIFVYYSHYDDKIESVATGGQIDGRDIVKSANTKQVRITGVEFFEDVQLADTVSMTFSFFWTWGEQSRLAGGFEPADRIPPLQGKIGFPLELSDRFSVEPYLRFASSQRRLSARDKRDPRINPSGTPSWATLNLRGQFDWNDRMSLSGELRNLTNANYREHGSGIQAQGIGLACSFQLSY